MADRRRSFSDVTPASEDAGLFPRAPAGVEVDLVPQLARNKRGDVLVRGFVGARQPILVVFAGRRAPFARMVEARLSRTLAMARAARGAGIDLSTVRLRIWVEGAWRRRFIRDISGWQQGEHHLIAAQWTLPDPPGPPILFGERAAATAN
ncbi:MAG: hypothetical protein AAGM84_12125 [Pseudomonadota bacterium]